MLLQISSLSSFQKRFVKRFVSYRKWYICFICAKICSEYVITNCHLTDKLSDFLTFSMLKGKFLRFVWIIIRFLPFLFLYSLLFIFLCIFDLSMRYTVCITSWYKSGKKGMSESELGGACLQFLYKKQCWRNESLWVSGIK